MTNSNEKYGKHLPIIRLLSILIVGIIVLSGTTHARFAVPGADSDSDGLSNLEERFLYGTDPYDWDTDNDHLSDGDELNIYFTDPLDQDMDSDRLYDYEILQYGTSPFKADTDYDGLSDYEEVTRYNTDPNLADTDSDLFNDRDELILYMTDPLDVNDFPMPDLVVNNFLVEFFENETSELKGEYPQTVGVTAIIENQGNYRTNIWPNRLLIDYYIEYTDYDSQLVSFRGTRTISLTDAIIPGEMQVGEVITISEFLVTSFDEATYDALVSGSFLIVFDVEFELDSSYMVIESDELNNEYTGSYSFSPRGVPTISMS
mgnify:FL=1